MTKTAEELYAERLKKFTHDLMVGFFEDGVDHLTVHEYLAERGEDSEDTANDVADAVNAALEELSQRYQDEGN